MSRLPQQVYGYHPANYYYEEADDTYVGDYSESDGISETPPHMVTGTADITELYRRKMAAAIPTQQERFQQQQQHPYYYTHDCYFYEPLPPHLAPRRSVISPTPTLSATAYRRHLPPTSHQEERIAHFYTTEAVDETYNAISYRSSPQIPQQRPVTARCVPSSTLPQPARRHPVTVRTPRFFRRSQATSMRKPSTLCLPVNCQPDPAIVKKSKPQYAPVEKHKLPRQIDVVELKPNSAGDIEAVPSDLDNMLNNYERMLTDGKLTKQIQKMECEQIKSSTAVASPKVLKPRVPASVKARQQKLKLAKSSRPNLKQSSTSVGSRGGRVEVEEITTEVLDQLLAELMNNGCENKLKTDKNKEQGESRPQSRKETAEKRPQSRSDKQVSVESCEEQPKSINYKEISQHMFEVEQQEKEVSQMRAKKFDASSQVSPKEDSLCPHMSRSTYYHQPGRVPLEEALELHKSKSYIVNLIDRALSKELGTLPEIKFKEPYAVSGATSTDTMAKSTQARADRDVCVEISQALTESFISNPPHSVESKQELCCPCAHQRDEPLYLRQLRQLRWGHLKHIQREVRRLEDLERFLDSCSSTSNF